MKKLLFIGACILAAQAAHTLDARACSYEAESFDPCGPLTRTSTSTDTRTAQWGGADPIVGVTIQGDSHAGDQRDVKGENNTRAGGNTASVPVPLGRFDSIPEPPKTSHPVGAVTFDAGDKTKGGTTVIIERHDDDQH